MDLPGCLFPACTCDLRAATPGSARTECVPLFGDTDLHTPLFNVEKDDEAINNAIKEAQVRLPEFCSAFDRLGDTSDALFKARFKTTGDDGGNEYIWCKASSLAAAGFTGIVLNHAVDPAVPTKDSIVTVKLDDIVDWAYVDEKQAPHGMFVERVLHARKR